MDMTTIPAIHGRPIVEVIEAQDDPHDPGWIHGKAARWSPDRGWRRHNDSREDQSR